MGAVRLLMLAKDDKTYHYFLDLWQRTIPPTPAKRPGFSDDGRHTFPLIDAIEREMRDKERKERHPKEVISEVTSEIPSSGEGEMNGPQSAEGPSGESQLSQGAA